MKRQLHPQGSNLFEKCVGAADTENLGKLWVSEKVFLVARPCILTFPHSALGSDVLKSANKARKKSSTY